MTEDNNLNKFAQNITRDIEVKNSLTIARGEGGRDREDEIVGRRVFRNYYGGHMDIAKGEGGSRGGRWVWLGCGRGVGRKCRQL